MEAALDRLVPLNNAMPASQACTGLDCDEGKLDHTSYVDNTAGKSA